ncbi:hypothetical protein A4D02_17210 [Niastella koreensis]|uniref:Uncharacterized protein n=2 Tax=Niastella koreensis TaxID=354356 RepID=G8TE60_NIAKG|nr:hypothetical protein [Niastella koreensis]AEV97251.1 hypothetical protein Niako_0872 [Niastella koreensis GR20-10]OQP39074.1 hypothetical protein A4D02_17210 [Niastella koreensis]
MKPLTRYILLFASILSILLPKRTARACGFWVPSNDYRFWLLQPDLTNEADLTPLFFGSRYLYLDETIPIKENYIQQNVQEWLTEIKGKALAKDIDTLLNATDPQIFFDEQKQLAKGNSFVRFLLQPPNSELYRYVTLSKKVEQIAAHPDPWEEDNFPNNNINEVIKETLAFQTKTHSQFIKLRLAYQLMRLYARNGEYDKIPAVYDNRVERVQTNSWVKSAALYEKAIHADGLTQNYLLSKVFDRGDYHQQFCLRFIITGLIDSTLSMTKNKYERTVLSAMKIFSHAGRSLPAIKNIYQAEPGFKELPFLLLREINKVEDWLVTMKLTDFGKPAYYGDEGWDDYKYPDNAAANYKKDKQYANELYTFLLQVIKDGKCKQPALLQLYASHMCLLNKDYTTAAQHLEQVKAAKHLPTNLRTQININAYLLYLEQHGFNNTAETAFMRIVQTPDASLGIYNADKMKNQLVLYTARKMIKNGDRARGLLLLSRTNRALGELENVGYKFLYQKIDEVAQAADYDQMIQVLQSKNKTPFEQFVSQHRFRFVTEEPGIDSDDIYRYEYTWDINKLRDLKASWYLRHHQLLAAHATLRQVPDSFYNQYPYNVALGGDAFYLNIYHPHPAAKEDKRNLNKKQVIEEMERLEQLADNNPQKAGICYYQLANAWYNMSWYGKNWMMVRQWWSSGDKYDYEKHQFDPFFMDYLGCNQAMLYYKKAMTATSDKKLKTLCFYMVQQCEKNRNEEYHLDNTAVYAAARRKGIDAGYYQSLVNECELYSSFIQQYNKRPFTAN